MQGAPTQAPLSVYLRGDDMAELQPQRRCCRK